VATPTTLTKYAVAHYKVGRSIAHRLNVCDVSSKHCQRVKGVRTQSLSHYDEKEGQWQEILVEDGRATPADVAASRIDFQAWLQSLSPRMRALAETLATGETTDAVATLFRVSAGRISQIRRKLMETWHQFHADRVDQPTLVGA